MPEFLYRTYAEENSDVAEKYGADDEGELLSHFQQYGREEMRGGELEHYCRLEVLLISDLGDIYIAGWADRRVLPCLRIAIDIGYQRHELSNESICWYQRPDVSALIGDTRAPSGFITLLRLPNVSLHPRVRIYFNGKLVREEAVMRWLSPNRFLDQALGAAAVLADQPIGRTIGHARVIHLPFQQAWLDVAQEMTFTLAFDSRRKGKVDRSIIIVLHRKASMLLVQLQALGHYLEQTATEVVIVGNDLIDPYAPVQDLTAFCQLYDVEISLHLCSGNAGFALGNNHGVDVARGETVILMNPDIFPAEHAPERSLAFLDGDPGTALHGALLYYGDGTLMHSGMYATQDLAFDTSGTSPRPVLRVEHFGKGLMHRIDDPDTALDRVMAEGRGRSVLASAALWKMRKAEFERHGGLPADYIYAYYEDADFCLRLLESGGSIVIDDRSRWLHLEGVNRSHAPHVRSFMWLNRYIFTERFADSPHVADRMLDLTAL